MYIQVRTSDRKRILESKDIQIFDDGSRRLLIGLSDTVECLGDHPEELESLAAACLAKHGDLGHVALHAVLGTLADSGLLVLTAHAEAPRVSLIPYTRAVLDKILSPVAAGRYKLSRFTLLRPGDRGSPCRLECPRAHAHIEVIERELAALAGACIAAREVEVLAEGTQSDKEVDLFFRALVAGGFVMQDMATGDGDNGEPELPYWDFHELYFHSRSRAGRHHDPMGATFKMANRFPPEPAVKRAMNAIARISLPIPNYSEVARRDVPLTIALETRRSIRSHGGPELSIHQLGEFLHRTCAVRSSWVSELGEFTRRTYPSGGASYDVEIYPLINRVKELQRGLYHYDPLGHSLEFLSAEEDLHRETLWDAFRSSAQTCYPDILFLLASRFKRISWKYSGMSYATTVKHVGVIYANMYLVGTAMHLATCALGLGNSDHFARLSGLDYYEEGSVGEFMLGQPA